MQLRRVVVTGLGALTPIGNDVPSFFKGLQPGTSGAGLITRFDTENFTLGLSYDVNVSSLRAGTNGNGGFELALQYRIKGKENRGIICPEF